MMPAQIWAQVYAAVLAAQIASPGVHLSYDAMRERATIEANVALRAASKMA